MAKTCETFRRWKRSCHGRAMLPLDRGGVGQTRYSYNLESRLKRIDGDGDGEESGKETFGKYGDANHISLYRP